MTKEVLKPCPFCGGSAVTYIGNGDLFPPKIDYVFEIRCIYCNASTLDHACEEDAIEHWNTRV